jgi:hypothetical protein
MYLNTAAYIHFNNPATPVIASIVAAALISGVILVLVTRVSIYKGKHQKKD